MRYYVMFIEYNREKQAENRSVPKAYDTLDEAVAQFHTTMGADMKTDSLGWALGMVINSDGGIHKNEKWTRAEEVTE